MSAQNRDSAYPGAAGKLSVGTEIRRAEALLKTGALQSAIFNSANFSSIATDEKGVIQIFNVGAERMLGYAAADVMNKITPADISDPQEVIARAQALSLELATPITPGFEALVFKASRGIEDIYELTYIRKDGSRFPAVVSVTALRDVRGDIIGYLLIGTDNSARKRAEEALLKAGALQSAIFNSANFSSIATDEKGVIQIFNVGAERMLGYAAADVMNKITPADISDPQEVIARAQALSLELATTITPGFEALVFKASRGIEDIYELTYIRKDGSRFPAVVSVTALRDVRGGIIGYLLIGTDNSARKQAEEALLKAGALQSAIFNSANFSSIATDEKGVIQIFNVGAERMLGYAAAEVMNKITPADISDPEEVIVRAEALSLELATPITPGFEALVFKASRGIEDIYELTYIRKDGSRFPAIVSVTALRDVRGGIIGYLLIGTDNTARKQVEAEQKKLDQRLRDQQFYTRSLIESNIDALMTTDPSGIISDVNKQMEALTGCTRDELIGAPFKNYFTDPARAEAAIKLVLREKHLTNYELTARARDGQETVVSYNATTFYDRDRTLQGVFAAARDVTERKRLDQALEDKNVELERAKIVAEKANFAKSDFLSTMSHELRTPLNAILGFSELLNDERYGTLNDRQHRYVSNIRTGGKHLLKLINDLLDLSRIEAGHMELARESVAVDTAVSEALSALQPLADGKSQRLVQDVGKGISVWADATRFQQVLMNLLANAIKFTPNGGRIQISARLTGERVRVEVQDSGPGIPPEEQKRIFEAFYRLRQSGQAPEGTGLGLAITQHLVELQDGVLGLESEPGKGSCFYFELPAGGRVPTALPKEASPLPATTKRLRILVIDDEPAAAELIRSQLTASGYEVNLCGQPERATELAAQLQPDAITLDLLMKPVHGWEILRQLKSNPRTALIPVVVVSVMDQPGVGASLGADEYLVKPVEKEDLLAAMRRCLGGKGGVPLKRSVLVVEDDTATRELIGELLRGQGYSVVTASDGAEARSAVEDSLPELVILDLLLPKTSGLELLVEWRADPRTADLPVFVLSSKDLSPEEEKYLRSHAEALLRKHRPWKEDLLNQLKKALGPAQREKA